MNNECSRCDMYIEELEAEIESLKEQVDYVSTENNEEIERLGDIIDGLNTTIRWLESRETINPQDFIELETVNNKKSHRIEVLEREIIHLNRTISEQQEKIKSLEEHMKRDDELLDYVMTITKEVIERL